MNSKVTWERIEAQDVKVGDTVARVRDLDRADKIAEVRPGATAVRLVSEDGGSIRPRKDSKLWRVVDTGDQADQGADEAAQGSGQQGEAPRHSSPVVAALENAWGAIQRRNPDTPDVVIVIGTGRDGRRKGLKYGHYEAGAWQNGSGRLPEVLISGEGMERGAVGVLTTLIHEAAHAVAKVRGIQDTSRQGRYHNKRFKAIAEEMGLKIDHDPRIGWSPSSMPEDTEADYRAEIDALQAALDIYRPDKIVLPDGGRKSAPPAECDCGRKIRVAPSVLDQAPIVCGSCGGDFEVRS